MAQDEGPIARRIRLVGELASYISIAKIARRSAYIATTPEEAWQLLSAARHADAEAALVKAHLDTINAPGSAA